MARLTWSKVLTVLLTLLLLVSAAGVFGQTEGDVRLVNGRSEQEGRAEYFQDGVWVSLCFSLISRRLPRVLCGQLGLPTKYAMRYKAPSFGVAPGEIFRHDLNCGGTDVNLTSCKVDWEKEVSCDPAVTLGVTCSEGNSPQTPVRLVNVSSAYEGRLEVYKFGAWGTVCRSGNVRDVTEIINARVACQELYGSGYGGVYLPSNSSVGRWAAVQTGSIAITDLSCSGKEKSILSCRNNFGAYDIDCSHAKDAMLRCFEVPAGCGDYLMLETGNVTYPGQIHKVDTDCVWKIKVTNKQQVNLTFTDIQGEGADDENYIQIVNSDGVSVLATSRGEALESVISTGDVIYIRQRASGGTTGVGFETTWAPATVNCNRTINKGLCQSGDYQYTSRPVDYGSASLPPNLDCFDHHLWRSSWNVSVSFNSLFLDQAKDGDCQDYVEIINGSSIADTSLGRFCERGFGAPAFTSLSPQFLLHLHTDDVTVARSSGFMVTVKGQEEDPEVSTLTDASGVITSPGYPLFYGEEKDYVWTITTEPYNTVSLTFSSFEVTCGCNNMLLIRDRVRNGRKLAEACGMEPPETVESNTNVMHIRLQTSPRTDFPVANRFSARWTAECRRVLDTFDSGKFTSPLFPKPYPPNLDCVWIIRRPHGHYVTLNVTSLNLDAKMDGNCGDYITVRDGSSESSLLLANRLCRNITAESGYSITSTRQSIWLKFHTDDVTSPSGVGFSVTYTTHAKECESTKMTTNSGSFRSPNFPFPYPQATYCVWTITVISGFTVRLRFDQFAVGSKRNDICDGAHVRVYDSDVTDAEAVLETLCGSTVPANIVSIGPSLTVVLSSFGFLPEAYSGFQAYYRVTPNPRTPSSSASASPSVDNPLTSSSASASPSMGTLLTAFSTSPGVDNSLTSSSASASPSMGTPLTAFSTSPSVDNPLTSSSASASPSMGTPLTAFSTSPGVDNSLTSSSASAAVGGKDTSTRLKFKVAVNVTFTEQELETERSRSEIQENAKNGILTSLEMSMDDLLDVKIVSMRRVQDGGVVLDVEGLVANDDRQSSASSLSAGLVGLVGESMTLIGQTGTMKVFVNGTLVSSNMTSCDVFLLYVTCATENLCQVVDDKPGCGGSPRLGQLKAVQRLPQDSITAMIVGIPIAVMVTVASAVACAKLRRRRRDTMLDGPRGDTSHPARSFMSVPVEKDASTAL